MEPKFEIRDPVHGFVLLNEWERDLIKHPVFQRLRRIRQLAWTDMVYPGGMHTRFEHTLGVMHVASLMFQNIRTRCGDFLHNKLGYDDTGLGRDHQLLRLACLCHDLGHSPFSHAGEELMPKDLSTKKPYKHEHYSAAAVRFILGDLIEDHACNENFGIKADEVADFIIGGPTLKRRLLWKSLLTGQIDADRADYLLRDSHHIGVAYGRYDLARLLNTLTVVIDEKSGSAVVAVERGGFHAAEALIMARYMMFTQVYFHKTRRAYDHHITEALKFLLEAESGKGGELIKDGHFPPPDCAENLERYLKWDDWRVLGCLARGEAGEHGELIKKREHQRMVFETAETPDEQQQTAAKEILAKLSAFSPRIDEAAVSWYKFENLDIPVVVRDRGEERVENLSQHSSLVRGLKSVNQLRVYVPLKHHDEAKKLVAKKPNAEP
jgi:HD superfamily phosphohydrolase